MGSRPKKMMNVISEMASTMPAIFAMIPILGVWKEAVVYSDVCVEERVVGDIMPTETAVGGEESCSV